MSKRVAVVTGGIGGLGTEICKYLARSGHKVVAADLGSRAERVAEFKAEMAEFGDQVIFESLNVADFDRVRRRHPQDRSRDTARSRSSSTPPASRAIRRCAR